MTTIKCLDCPMEHEQWYKMNQHRELTGHRFAVFDSEGFDQTKLTPKDFSEDDMEFLNG